MWCGGGWFCVRLAGKTLPTDSSEELLLEVSLFFFSFLAVNFLLDLLVSVPWTLADMAPLGIGDFNGLNFLKSKIFFFLGVFSSGKPTVVPAF